MAGFVLSDEIVARRELLYDRDARDPLAVLDWLVDNVAPGASLPTRLRRGLDFALHGREFVREGFRNTCEVAQRFARRLDMSAGVQAALLAGTWIRQRRGRVCGVAVEGSMHTTLAVHVIKRFYCDWPRFEDEDFIMTASSISADGVRRIRKSEAPSFPFV